MKDKELPSKQASINSLSCILKVCGQRFQEWVCGAFKRKFRPGPTTANLRASPYRRSWFPSQGIVSHGIFFKKYSWMAKIQGNSECLVIIMVMWVSTRETLEKNLAATCRSTTTADLPFTYGSSTPQVLACNHLEFLLALVRRHKNDLKWPLFGHHVHVESFQHRSEGPAGGALHARV